MAESSSPLENHDTGGGDDNEDRILRDYIRKHHRARKQAMFRNLFYAASIKATKTGAGAAIEEATGATPAEWAKRFIGWLGENL